MPKEGLKVPRISPEVHDLVSAMAEQQGYLLPLLRRWEQFVNCPSPDAISRLRLAMNDYAAAYDAAIAAKAGREE